MHQMFFEIDQIEALRSLESSKRGISLPDARAIIDVLSAVVCAITCKTFAGHFRGNKETAENIIRWTIAFMVAVKCTLRREQVSVILQAHTESRHKAVSGLIMPNAMQLAYGFVLRKE